MNTKSSGLFTGTLSNLSSAANNITANSPHGQSPGVGHVPNVTTLLPYTSYGAGGLAPNMAPYSAFQAFYPYYNDDEPMRLYKSSIFFEPHNDVMQRHLFIWRQTNPPWDDDVYIQQNIHAPNGSHGHIYFYDEDHLKEFEHWWKTYSSHFKNVVTDDYPYLPAGAINGFCVLDAEPINPCDVFNQWIFIVKNIKNLAYRTINGWVFKTAEEASMFKLTRQ